MNWEDYGSENKDRVLETERMIRHGEVASRVAQDQTRRRKRERLAFGLTALLSTAVVGGVAFSNIGGSEPAVSTALRQSSMDQPGNSAYDLLSSSEVKDGNLIRCDGDGFVYLIEDGRRRRYTAEEMPESWNLDFPASLVDCKAIPEGIPLPPELKASDRPYPLPFFRRFGSGGSEEDQEVEFPNSEDIEFPDTENIISPGNNPETTEENVEQPPPLVIDVSIDEVPINLIKEQENNVPEYDILSEEAPSIRTETEGATEGADESEVAVEVVDTTTGAVLDKISNAVEVSSEIIGEIVAQKQVVVEVEDDATGTVEEERPGVVLIIKNPEGDLEEEVIDESTGEVIEEGTTKNDNEVIEEVTKDAIDLTVPGLPIPDEADESITISENEIQSSEEATDGVSENPAPTEFYNDEEEVLHIRPVHGDGELAVDSPDESMSVINEPEIIESTEVGPESEHHGEGEVNSDTAGKGESEIEPSVNEGDDKDEEPVDVQNSVVAMEDAVPEESVDATGAETVIKESAVDVVATADGDAYEAGEDIESEQIGDVESEITGDGDTPALKKYLIESQLQNPNDFVLSDDTDDHQLVDAAAIYDDDGYYHPGMYHIMDDFVESYEISDDVGTSDAKKEEGDSIPDGTTGGEKVEGTDQANLTSETTSEIENEVPEKSPDTVETENDGTAGDGNKDTEESNPKADENSAVAAENEVSSPHEHSEPNEAVVDNIEPVVAWAVEDKNGAIVDVVNNEAEAVEEVAENEGEIVVEVIGVPDTDPAITSQEETEKHPTESHEEDEHSFEVVDAKEDGEIDQTPVVPDEPVANGKGGAVDEVAVDNDNDVIDAKEIAEDDERDVVEEEGHEEVTGNAVGILDQEETGPGEDEEGDKHTDEVDTTDSEHVQGIAVGEFYPTHNINEAEDGQDATNEDPAVKADLHDGEEESEPTDNENSATHRALRA